MMSLSLLAGMTVAEIFYADLHLTFVHLVGVSIDAHFDVAGCR